MIHSGKSIFEKFAVLMSIAIVWIYAHLLTVGGAYNHTPQKTQISCRTDRSGLIEAAPWLVLVDASYWDWPLSSLDASCIYKALKKL